MMHAERVIGPAELHRAKELGFFPKRGKA